jgi:hypothetical protein
MRHPKGPKRLMWWLFFLAIVVMTMWLLLSKDYLALATTYVAALLPVVLTWDDKQ